MVRHMLLIFSLFLPLVSNASGLTAESLRDRIKSKENKREEINGRLRGMKKNSTAVSHLRDRRLFYRLPDGRSVRAVILPNNKKSPAIMDGGNLSPACLTTSNTLVAGRFDDKEGVVVCEISAAKLAFIDDSIYGSEKEAVNRVERIKANKYSSSKKNVENIDIKESSSKNDSEEEKKHSASKYSKGSNKKAQKKPANPNIYTPPSSNTKNAVVTGLSIKDSNEYGIKIGTWAEVRLLRPISSADSGKVEFVLQDDISGDYRTLPAGTVLFGSKQINVANKRLESFVDFAITPDGEEVDKLSAWIYSPNQTAGLPGKLVRDREGEAKAAGSNAALKGLGAAASQVGGAGAIGGTIVDSYTDDIVNNERRYAPSTPRAVIKVGPQLALIKFSKTF